MNEEMERAEPRRRKWHLLQLSEGGVRCEDSRVATGVDLNVGDVGAEKFRKKAMPVILT